MAQNNLEPLINGNGYDWSQIVLNILGSPIYGVSSINYNEEQEITDTYGAGNFPVERGFGQITFSGSITFHAKEIELLTDIAPNRRIQNIPEFDVIVSFLNDNKVVTHTLKNCRFKNNGRETSSGDTAIEKEIELAIGKINW